MKDKDLSKIYSDGLGEEWTKFESLLWLMEVTNHVTE